MNRFRSLRNIQGVEHEQLIQRSACGRRGLEARRWINFDDLYFHSCFLAAR